MKETVKIRFATSEDAELLAKLGRETFHDAFAENPLMPQDDLQLYLDSAFTVSNIASELKDTKTIFLLAEIDSKAVGYAKLDCGVTTDGVSGENPIKLKRLYNKQEFIGFGIGKSLMLRCFDEAKKLNHDTIWLTVWKHNLQAQNFYRKFQFEECGTFDFHLGETTFLDVLMQRWLS
ncbi:MAG: N-acetyltransferase [Acidobacteriota bacterium]